MLEQVPIRFIKTKKAFGKKLIFGMLIGLIAAGMFSGSIYVFARTSPYNPGDTLDPDCAPGELNCTVATTVPYTGATTNVNLGTHNLTTTGTITGGTLKVGSVYTLPTTDGTSGQVLSTNGSGTLSWSSVSGGAPTDATYITQTSNSTLSNEQALSSLSTGIMRVATTTGVITSLTDSAGIAANISDETGSGALVFGTSPTIATPTISTSMTVPLVIGGTATTSDLSLQTTSGVGTTGADMHFLVGNNGATEAMTILNSGNVGIGTASPGVLLHVNGTLRAGATGSSNFSANVSNEAISGVYYSGGERVAMSANSNDFGCNIGSSGGMRFTASNNAVIAGGAGGLYLAPCAGSVGVGLGLTPAFGTNNKFLVNPYNTVDNLATAQISTTVATNKGLVVQGYTSQSANLQEWQNSAGTVLASVDSSGNLTSPNLTLSTGGALRTSTSAGNTLLLQAYDTDTGPAYTTFATLTAGTTPTMDLSSSVTLGGNTICTTGSVCSGYQASGSYLLATGATTGATSQSQVFTNGVTLSNLTSGRVPYATTGGQLTDSANMTFDGTNLTVTKIIGGTATTSDLSLQTTSGVGTTGADMHFLVGNNGATEAMTILNSGNVGIGTTAPAATPKLDIRGQLWIQGSGSNGRFVVGESYENNQYGSVGWNAASNYMWVDAHNGQALVLQSGNEGSGNVGIANSSPGALLDIGTAGTTAGVIRLEGGTSGYVALQPTAAAGNVTITFPAETGTVCTTGSVCSGYQAAGSYLTGVTADAPLSGSGTSGSHLVLGYNTTNLQITSSNLNTIQDIATSSSPSFTALTATGATGLTLGTRTTTNIPGYIKLIAAGDDSAYYTTITAGTNTGNTTITLPTANPAGTYLLNMTSGGVIGYDSNTYYKSGDSPSFAAITDTGLTSGRVTYATTGGQLTDNAGFTFDGTNLAVPNLNLSASSNQIVLQSNGVTGTITATPTSSGKTWTFPDATGTVITTGNLSGITATGTIASGTWNGTAIDVAHGGTGATSLTGILKGNGTDAVTALTGTADYVTYWSDANTLAAEQYLATSRGGLGASVTAAGAGELLYSSSTTAYGHLAAGTSGMALISGGAAAPGWGTLGLGYGGTNAGLSATNGGIVYSTDTAMAISAAGSSGQALLSGGAGAPTWGSLGVAAGGTGLGSGTSGGIPYFDSSSTMASSAALAQYKLVVGGGAGAAPATLSSAGTAGQLLTSGGGSANPGWTTATYPSTATGTGTILRADGTNWAASTSTFADTYTANNLLYASSANTVAGLATGNNGVLVTDGSGVPSISSTLPSAVQANITAVGTIASGTWNGSAISVDYGGTGKTSLTAYALLAGGTTATGALQQVSGVGTSGQVLTSAGAGALPTWQTPSGGANQNLGNLTATAINQSLIPEGVATAYDLGSATLPWRYLYIYGDSSTPGTNNFQIKGTSTSGTRVITLPDATGTVPLGTGTSGQVTYWSGTNAVTSDTGLTYATGVLGVGSTATASGTVNLKGVTSGTASVSTSATGEDIIFDPVGTGNPSLLSDTGILTIGGNKTANDETMSFDFTTGNDTGNTLHILSATGMATWSFDGSTAPYGDTAWTIIEGRRSTSTYEGKDLTIQAGGAVSGSADYFGGNLNLSSGISTGSGSSSILFKTATAGASATTDRLPTTKMTITGAGNIGIGTSTFGTDAVGVLAIANGTAPSTSITDGVQLFAVDVSSSSELKVRDEAGNVTTLSPHNFSLFQPSRDYILPWSYTSENTKNDMKINVDMYGAIQAIEALTGKQFIYAEKLSTGETVDRAIERDGTIGKLPFLAKDNGWSGLAGSVKQTVSSVKDSLNSMGMFLENGFATVKELVADKISVKTAKIEGLEMIDQKTGEVYCAWIANGEWQKAKGNCDSVSVETAIVANPQVVTNQLSQAAEQAQQVVQQAQTAANNALESSQHAEQIAQQVAQQVVEQAQQTANKALETAQQAQEAVEQLSATPTPTPTPEITPTPEPTPEITPGEQSDETKKDKENKKDKKPVENASEVIKNAASALMGNMFEFLKWVGQSLGKFSVKTGASLWQGMQNFKASELWYTIRDIRF